MPMDSEDETGNRLGAWSDLEADQASPGAPRGAAVTTGECLAHDRLEMGSGKLV